jgi:uncharacterized membrane protein YphA (DoxX/SURF4 family)
MFPAGAAGAALLLLRASVAATLIVDGTSVGSPIGSAWVLKAAIALVFFLLLGLLTPYASVLTCLFQLGALLCTGWDHGFHLFVSAVNSAVLAILGPGAWSIDARVFGRRIVRLPPVTGRGRKEG